MTTIFLNFKSRQFNNPLTRIQVATQEDKLRFLLSRPQRRHPVSFAYQMARISPYLNEDGHSEAVDVPIEMSPPRHLYFESLNAYKSSTGSDTEAGIDLSKTNRSLIDDRTIPKSSCTRFHSLRDGDHDLSTSRFTFPSWERPPFRFFFRIPARFRRNPANERPF